MLIVQTQEAKQKLELLISKMKLSEKHEIIVI